MEKTKTVYTTKTKIQNKMMTRTQKTRKTMIAITTMMAEMTHHKEK